jgi:hypothetical protein
VVLLSGSTRYFKFLIDGVVLAHDGNGACGCT